VVHLRPRVRRIQASIQTLDLNAIYLASPSAVCDVNSVCAASVAVLNGTTMYLAGNSLNPGRKLPLCHVRVRRP